MTERPSTTERAIKDVKPPINTPLSHDKLWTNDGLPNLGVLKDHLVGEGRLNRDDALLLITKATELFTSYDTMIKIKSPIVVVGDIHGQFYDLLKLLEMGGDPKETQYLFMGDYVDRGMFGCETVLYLYALKLTYPTSLHMLRGNHECRHMTDFFQFKHECEFKYDGDLYDAFMNSFDALPLAALVNEQFFCVHGGISPEVETLDDVRRIDRFRETPSSGPMCDLLWADPVDGYDTCKEDGFLPNDKRNCSWAYTYSAVTKFLDSNKLMCCIRGHESEDEGYKMYKPHATTGFPTVITLFSAANYCDAYGNEGAILEYDVTVMNIKQYRAVPHPYWLPNYQDAVTWTVPYVAEYVTEILSTLLDITASDEDRKGDIRAKMTSVARVLRTFKVLRTERDNILKLKSLVPNMRLPMGLLQSGPDAIQDALQNFATVKAADRQNEMRPSIP